MDRDGDNGANTPLDSSGESNGNFLRLEDYLILEEESSIEIPLPILTAFTPLTYQRNGVPVGLRSEKQLIRYVDHNFEPETPELFQPGARFAPACYVNSFSRDEKSLIGPIRDKVAALTRRMFGRPMRPVSNILSQVAPFRILSELSRLAGRATLSVYEAGPGLGYLGALLASAGHRYVGYDVTQALYVWQNRLLGTVAGADFVEGALVPAADDGSTLAGARVLHLPWWRHYALFGDPSFPVDVVYSNSNLCEMSGVCARLLMRRARPLLEASPVGMFVFMSWGFPGQSTAEGLHGEFGREGYRRVQNLPFKAYVPLGRDTTAIEEAFADGIPLHNPSGAPERLDAADMVPLSRAEAPIDVAATMEYYGWRPPFVD